MSDFYDYCNPDSIYLIPNDGILVFFPKKIFLETQDEVSIFTLLHTINNFFLLLLLPQFFHQIFVGGLVFGTIFWSSSGMAQWGGGTRDGDGVR